MKSSFALPASALIALAAAALPAQAVEVYALVLSGPSESPANASPGIGVGVVTIDTVLNTMHLQTTFAGLLGNVTNSHIHCCVTVAGAGTAGVATTTPTFADFPKDTTFGSYDKTLDMTLASSFNPTYVAANGGTPATAWTALLDGIHAGKAYWNIHSQAFGGGEIRGFLAPAPEPESYALMLAGLGVIAWFARKGKNA